MLPPRTESRLLLELTLEQAAALAQATDLYARLCIGQLEELEMLIREGTIPCADTRGSQDRTAATMDQCSEILALLKQVKAVLGYHPNGSHGIGHAHVHVTGTRAYEIKKVVDRALAEHRDPNPSFRGVNYDGLICRYTTDPAPLARVQAGADCR